MVWERDYLGHQYRRVETALGWIAISMGTSDKKSINILFVCMGNICRSPTAHGVFENMVRMHGLEDIIHVDSAGTHAYHIGERPDPRSRAMAESRGYDISYVRARGLSEKDYLKFDYLLAMDKTNLNSLQVKSPLRERGKLELFMDYHPDRKGEDVPDPYFKESDLFDVVFDLVEDGCQNLLKVMRNRYQL